MSKPFIGIDLGTTFSVVARLNDEGQAVVVPNHIGQMLTPSVVDLSTTPPTVGWEAKERQEFGDEGTVAFFKRDMGNANALYIHEGREYSPVDLSALVLDYLKTCVEDEVGVPVRDAVITVPAYFNNMQRQATIAAGEKAGLTVLRIINEPTAAALAYGLRPAEEESRFLVYDLGGGTFDVSLVQLVPQELRVIATAGDHFLGGKDWDDRILQYLAHEFEGEHGLALLDDELDALLAQAEDAKISLSTRPSVQVTVQAKGHVGRYRLDVGQFEDMTRDLMERTQQLVNQVLDDADMRWDDVSGVVLVGGSTRMPMVRRYVEQMSGRPPMTGIHPDQAVALGAAMQAAMDIEQHSTSTLLLAGRKQSVDVISNSLGMIAENEDRTRYINSIIIPKNQPIPCQQTRPYQLRISRQQSRNMLEVFMTQGEVTDPQHCTYLGKYVFSGLPAVQGQRAVIDITYAYNINGVVEVSAVERSTGQSLELTIEPLPHDIPERFLQPPVQISVREHVTVYMALDVSGSMMGTALRNAKDAAHRFLAQIDLTSASVGIIEWSDRAKTIVHASQNANELHKGIDRLRVGHTGYGTRGNPFETIYDLLQHTEGLRYGMVLTDGELDRRQLALQSARQCQQAGIEIVAIGFGRADKDFLRQVSSSDEHSFFVNMNQLVDTFSTIAQEITEGGGHIDPDSLRERRKGMQLL